MTDQEQINSETPGVHDIVSPSGTPLVRVHCLHSSIDGNVVARGLVLLGALQQARAFVRAACKDSEDMTPDFINGMAFILDKMEGEML